MNLTLFLALLGMTKGIVQVIATFMMSTREMGGLLLGIAQMTGVLTREMRYSQVASLFIFVHCFDAQTYTIFQLVKCLIYNDGGEYVGKAFEIYLSHNSRTWHRYIHSISQKNGFT
jgi:hypothetical protein